MDGFGPGQSPAATDGAIHDDAVQGSTALDRARMLLDGLDDVGASDHQTSPAQVADTLDTAVALLRDALQASAPD
jgi:hypothetical protein